MSVEARKWASGIYEISPREKAVLMCLADRHNPKQGYAWPSHASIARDTSFSVSTVKRAIKDLELKGLVISARQFDKEEHKAVTSRYYLVGHSQKIPATGKTFLVEQYFNEHGKWTSDDHSDCCGVQGDPRT